MNNKIIPYGRQSITQVDIDAVINTLQSDYLTQGPKVKEFEDKFAKYVGSKYAITVNNATSGLHISVLALGLKKGDRVITTPITFAPNFNSHVTNQLPLKPVCPVTKTVFPLYEF